MSCIEKEETMSSTQEYESLRMSLSSGNANYKKDVRKSAGKEGWIESVGKF